MATYLICHGAWSAGWAWKRVRPLLRAAGHEVFTPSYTGLGERAHLAHALVGLETHVLDTLAVIRFEDLRDIILVGHSYGGMVATGVADRAPDLIRRLVYLDAFVPNSGQSLNDLTGRVPEAQYGWLLAPNPPAPDTSAEDLAWIAPRRVAQPARCFSNRLHLIHPEPAYPRSYIHCTKKTGHDVFQQFADRFRAAPGWDFHEMAESHSPNITAPAALAEILLRLA